MTIHTALPGTGTSILGRTLPSLLDEACASYPNETAFNQFTGSGWQAFSNQAFRTASEETALGLQALGLDRGDRVAMYMHSDVYFGIVDMGCLIAGLIGVPIYLTNPPDIIRYIIRHAEAPALVVSDPELLHTVAPLLTEAERLRTVIVVQVPDGAAIDRPAALPTHLDLQTLDDVRALGRSRLKEHPKAVQVLKDRIDPHDVATFIYTSGTTGTPKGVVLTHENISHNAASAFSGIPVGHGAEEVMLSFLPMTHIFARTLHYGALHLGHSMYYTTPERVAEHFREVRPTQFATVPRVLEKVYDKIVLRGKELSGLQRTIFDWAMNLAKRYELGKKPTGLYALQLALADKLVFSRWREALGGRVKFVISGGAALRADLANSFGAAGVTIIQGYGLTETSPVITYNRIDHNRAGTVGLPMAGVEVALADDGEVITRGPHIMKGYFKNPEATDAAIDADSWFHTGDIGEFTDEGFLKITDRKKSLFKLSTGKYVVPQPIENALVAEPLIEQAVILGAGYKFCTALIFVNEEMLRAHLKEQGLDHQGPIEALCEDLRVRAIYQGLVDKANEGISHWESVKRFTLIPRPLTVESGWLTPSLKVKRNKVMEAFSDQVDAMYADANEPVSA